MGILFRVETGKNNFWHSRTLDQLIQEQQPRTVEDIFKFTSDFWPHEESVDEFVEFVYKQRQEDKLKA